LETICYKQAKHYTRTRKLSAVKYNGGTLHALQLASKSLALILPASVILSCDQFQKHYHVATDCKVAQCIRNSVPSATMRIENRFQIDSQSPPLFFIDATCLFPLFTCTFCYM